jgi:hypothetical protein
MIFISTKKRTLVAKGELVEPTRKEETVTCTGNSVRYSFKVIS